MHMFIPFDILLNTLKLKQSVTIYSFKVGKSIFHTLVLSNSLRLC